MGDYEFLLADYKDIPEILSVYHSLVGTAGCTWSLDYPSEATAESDVDSGSLYVCKKNGKIIAAASLGEFNELGHLRWDIQSPCELARIGVIPALQRQGVGTMVLKNVIKLAREKGFDGIRMLVSKGNAAALALYEKNGFERCGDTFMYDIDFYCYQIRFNDAVLS